MMRRLGLAEPGKSGRATGQGEEEGQRRGDDGDGEREGGEGGRDREEEEGRGAKKMMANGQKKTKNNQ